MKKRILLNFLTVVLCLATVSVVRAASSNYHNITTITYNNRITDQGELSLERRLLYEHIPGDIYGSIRANVLANLLQL